MTESSSSPSRRRWLSVGVAAVAAVAGGGYAWRRFQPHHVADGAEQQFWSQTFATPDGAPLSLQQFQGKPLLVNFWATWCPPCVEELPLLNRFHAERKVAVLGLAVDQPQAVLKFLAKLPLQFPIGMAGAAGTTLTRTLGNEQGGLPFSLLLGSDGRVAQRKIGQLVEDDLARWSQSL
jgi:thiol-disulfide isomerase/thioredoxin